MKGYAIGIINFSSILIVSLDKFIVVKYMSFNIFFNIVAFTLIFSSLNFYDFYDVKLNT